MPASNQAYTNQVLKVVVAQICQTIGFNSVQSTPMEVMIDVLHNYIRELCVLTKDYAEHYNRTEPNLDDVTLAYREMKINFNELREYMEYVDPIPLALPVPKYPIPKESHLNFLKPGSQEVLTRPMHIPEYMPPMQPEPEEEPVVNTEENVGGITTEEGVIKDELMLSPTAGASAASSSSSAPNQQAFFKKPADFPLPPGGTSSDTQRRLKFDGTEGLKETREISSVIMTTSGFISPAREGKLPDSKPPIIIPDKRPSPPPPPVVIAPPLPVSNMDNKFEEKAPKKKSHDSEKKEKKKVKKELFQPPPLPPVQNIPVPIENLPRPTPTPTASHLTTPVSHQHPLPHPPQFSPGFPEDIKPTLPIGPPPGPRKPGRPRKSESMMMPGTPNQPKDKVKKPKNPDAKLIKQIKKQVAAGILPPLPIQELLTLVKSQMRSQQPQQQQPSQFMPGPSMSNAPPGHNMPFSPQKMPQPMPPHHFEGKVASESDKAKLNIFKKMPSSSKVVHHDFPSSSMMKSEMFPGGISEMSPQKQKFKANEFDFAPNNPINMAVNKVLDFNRGSIEDLTMPTTPQYMPRTPDVKQSNWNKGTKDEQGKKRKEKPEKKMKKIKTPPLMPFFAPGPDLQNPMNRMSIPGMPNFPQMAQQQQQQQQQQTSRFPFFPNLIPSGPGLIPNNAFFPGPFGTAQFGAPPFNMGLFPGDIINNLNKIRTQLDHANQSSAASSSSVNQQPPIEIKQPQCNVPPLLPPTITEPLSSSHSLSTPTKKIRPESPPSLMKLPKDTVAIPIEPHHQPPAQISPGLVGTSKKISVEKLDEISVVKQEFKPSTSMVHQEMTTPSIPSSTSVNFDTVDLTSPKPEHSSSKDKEEKESKKDKKLKKKSKKKDKMKDKEKETSTKESKEERKRKKKEKRREKERLAMEQNKFLSSNTDSIDNSDSSLASVPKLTLKLGVSGDSRPNTPDIPKKMTIKSTFTKKKESDSDIGSSPLQMTISSHRESSPELAKFSALVTHPPKQKSSHKRKHDEDVFSGDDSKSSSKHMKSPSSGSESKKHKRSTPQPSSSGPPNTSQGLKTAKEDDGQQIWICPACGQVDNGTPMIGCDGCDAWYHWVCVGIQVPPDVNEDWYCRVCINRKQDGGEKKKKRKKNKEKAEKV